MRDIDDIKDDIINAFHFRHATKEFDSTKKIDDDDFGLILEAGRLSPSSFGFEPWRFLVIQNAELREKIKNTAWGTYGKLPSASHFVVILARTAKDTLYHSDYLINHFNHIKQMPEEFLNKYFKRIEEFQKDDFKLLEGERALNDWSSKQTYIPLANMMTAAALMGIDSCPIEGFNIERMNELLEEEGLLENGHFTISVMVAFGYRVKDPNPKTRRPFEDIIKWIE